MNQIFIEWSVCGPGWNTLGHEKGECYLNFQELMLYLENQDIKV